MSDTIILIPARMSSVRLPGKPLADIGGKPMIMHVWERAAKANVGPAYVATGDEEIIQAVEEHGGKVIKTDKELPSGSDRIFQALEKIDPEHKFSTIINLQGDLPDIKTEHIQAVVMPLNRAEIDIGTLVSKLGVHEENNPSVVKVACMFTAGGTTARALYFSRSLIPWGEGHRWHHIGIYAYRRSALEKFVALPPTLLERREKLEQLRALEGGLQVGCAAIAVPPLGIDTPQDLECIRRVMTQQAKC